MEFKQISILDWIGEGYEKSDHKLEEKKMEQRNEKAAEKGCGTGRGGHSRKSCTSDHEGNKKGKLNGRKGTAAAVPAPDQRDRETSLHLEAGTEEKEMNNDWFSYFMNLPEDPEHYGSRGEYIATLTPYGIACYLIAHQKNGNLTQSMLKSVEKLEKYFAAEVDCDGDDL